MMPEPKIYISLLIVFSFFCLNLSQAQTNAPSSGTNTLSQVLQNLQSIENDRLAPKTGKYEEYQSICRLNEYDHVAYYSDDLKKRRVDLLKDKIASAGEDANKLKLRLLKEYIDQNQMAIAKAQIDSLKKEKLTAFENDLLNALISFYSRNYSSARVILNKLLTTNEKNIEVFFMLAEVYIKLENYYEASAIYEDLNKLTNNSALPQLCESMVLNSANADAEKVCLQAIKKFPENPFPMIYKGISDRERLEFKKSHSAFQKSINIKPTEMGYVCLAESFYMKNNFSEAAEQFKLASAFSPKSIRAVLGQAWTLLKLKDFTGSLSAFKKACAVNGKYESEIRKAAKILTGDKIPDAKKFVQAAEACGG